MKKLTIALSSILAVASLSTVGFAQLTRVPAPVPSQPTTIDRNAPSLPTMLVGYPCQVGSSGDSTTVHLTTSSYCGGSPAGSFIIQKQWGTGINDSKPQIGYEMYGRFVERLIDDEPSHAPLADDTIAGLLARQGVRVARRTVAKYRDQLSIAPARQRSRAVAFAKAS